MRGAAVWRQKCVEKQAREIMTEGKHERRRGGGGARLNTSPSDWGSSIVFPTSRSITEQTDVDGDSSAHY